MNKVDQSEFNQYFKNLVQEAEKINPITGKCRKAGFQSAAISLLTRDKEHMFTGEQVREIFNELLNYKNESDEKKNLLYGEPPKKKPLIGF